MVALDRSVLCNLVMWHPQGSAVSGNNAIGLTPRLLSLLLGKDLGALTILYSHGQMYDSFLKRN